MNSHWKSVGVVCGWVRVAAARDPPHFGSGSGSASAMASVDAPNQGAASALWGGGTPARYFWRGVQAEGYLCRFSPGSAREGSRPDRCSEIENQGRRENSNPPCASWAFGTDGCVRFDGSKTGGRLVFGIRIVVLLSRVGVVAVVVLVSPKYDSGGHRGELIGSGTRERSIRSGCSGGTSHTATLGRRGVWKAGLLVPFTRLR